LSICRNKIFKSAVLTVLFYASAILIIFLLDKAHPAKPEDPSGGLYAFAVLLLTSIILFIVSLYKTVKVDKSKWIITLIHFIACVIMFST